MKHIMTLKLVIFVIARKTVVVVSVKHLVNLFAKLAVVLLIGRCENTNKKNEK